MTAGAARQPSADGDVMTESKKQPVEKTGKELSETDLAQASGGALNAYVPATDATHGTGGGGGAGKPAMGDGSVKTNSALIGLL
jgi:hypothetical protein